MIYVKDIDVVMSMHNVIEYSDNYSKTENSWQYYRDEPALTNAGAIGNFPNNNNYNNNNNNSNNNNTNS